MQVYLDVPRVVGVSLILLLIVLQYKNAADVRANAKLVESEKRYRSATIFPNPGYRYLA